VTIDPFRVRHVGRVSGVLDADVDGLPGDLAARRPVHEEAQLLRAVQTEAQAMGKRAFHRATNLPLTVAERAALGKAISARNLDKGLEALQADNTRRCALEGCDRPVPRPNALFCCKLHRDRAWRARRRHAMPRLAMQEQDFDADVACSNCGAILLGAAIRKCPACGQQGCAP
jgi:rubrerythrin